MAPRRFLALGLAIVAACGGGDDGDDRPSPAAEVATWNLFLGTGLEGLADPAALLNPPATVGRLWREVQATEPPARMAEVAEAIAARRPDLVGLQEAALFRIGPALPPATADTVVYDFVQLVLDGLAARGIAYRVAASVTNFDSPPLPDDQGNAIRFTDRDVILARQDVGTSDPRGATFSNALLVPLPGISFQIPRGWTSVRAGVGGGLLFVSTHLEAASTPIQEAQAREVVALVAGEGGRVVLVGDLNSPADRSESASYDIALEAGFTDAWTATRGADPGLTCCFPPDLRTVAPLRSRIDLVLLRGALQAVSAEVVGEEPGDRTPAGSWPSDHAGVRASLLAP